MAPPLTTTVAGSYTVPDWYPALKRAVAAGDLPPDAFRDANSVAAWDKHYRNPEAPAMDVAAVINAGADVLSARRAHPLRPARHRPS